jgi:hypothetical protein
MVRASGLSPAQADAVVESDAFGPFTAELRRAEAHYVDVASLLPRVVAARGFEDAQDIAAVLRAPGGCGCVAGYRGWPHAPCAPARGRAHPTSDRADGCRHAPGVGRARRSDRVASEHRARPSVARGGAVDPSPQCRPARIVRRSVAPKRMHRRGSPRSLRHRRGETTWGCTGVEVAEGRCGSRSCCA